MSNGVTGMRNLFTPIPLALFVCVALVSCGGGGGAVAPEIGSDQGLVLTSPNERNARAPEGCGNHIAWGVYTMVIDQEEKTVEILDNRELAFHLNVRGMLENPYWCPAKNCIKIQFLEIDEDNHIYTIKGTLVNPTHFTGFDVRAIIFYDEKGHDLLNADDYTMLYEEEDDINPFRSYAKTVENREFKPYSTFSEIFEMYIPPVPKKFRIDFAIDASWPSNCEEPYDLEDFGFEGSIYPDDPDLDGIDQGEGVVFTEAYDWQLNVSEVTVDTTPITGGITGLSYNADLNRWEATITDGEDASPGQYRCLIAAFSEDDPTLGLYNYVTIAVDETPPPAVQTICGHVGEAFWLTDLNGALVSVANQDPLGFSPEPAVVDEGQYCVNVTTGAFNMSVSYDEWHLSQVCWHVIVTENEDVRIDFGLNNPTLMDKYDPWGDVEPVNWPQIMGYAGRVVDDGGMPVSGATVELTSPDGWWEPGQDFVQAEVTDGDGYFSIIGAPVEVWEMGEEHYVHEYSLHVRAPGFRETVIGPMHSKANEVPYMVVMLLPYPEEDPIWADSFEEDSGWLLTGFWHRQLYNPSIVNVSFDPAYNFLVVPPDENLGGAIPPPTDGEWYLWYGVEADGNFIGLWDPDQMPYEGGISVYEHEGSAQSPQIDLSAYSEARVEFDMAFSIESQQPATFDMMYFYVNGMLTKILNPFPQPFHLSYTLTQRGENRTLIYSHYLFDLSTYTGGSVTLRFDFVTVDQLYNGCRGQFIDNIQVFAH